MTASNSSSTTKPQTDAAEIMGAVLFCAQLDTQTEFYTGVLGMQTVHSDESHAQLQGGYGELILHGVAGLQPPAETPAPVRSQAPTKLVFRVASLAHAREQAEALGGSLHPADSEWEYNGHRVCDGVDPEGNVFQLRAPSA